LAEHSHRFVRASIAARGQEIARIEKRSCLVSGTISNMATKKAGASIYAEHPGMKMIATSMKNLLDRTGKTLDEWAAIVLKKGPKGSKERRDWLMREHGFTTNYAWWVVERAEGDDGQYKPDEYVEKMFAGPKAGLRPIYEALVKLAFSMGKDVTLTPCSTIVPIRRKYVIAQIKPSTKTRIDFGYALKDTPASGRLVTTGGFEKGDRITHRIAISSVDEIDAEVKLWLKRAYEMDAPGN